MTTEVSNSKFQANLWLGTTLLTALCTMVYELILAQTLSSVMGNTTYRYSLTIGLYIASMGLGAILVDRVSKIDALAYFLRVELSLAVLGTLAPWLVLINDSLLQKYFENYYSSGIQLYSNFFNHGLIVGIGFLAGLELPLLMRIGKTKGINSSATILSWDYLGTTVGAILFPLVLFPNLNLFTMGYVFAALNSFVALIVAWQFNSKPRFKKLAILWIVILLGLIFFGAELNEWLVNYFYVRGNS